MKQIKSKTQITSVDFADITNKPATYAPTIGTTSTTALAGNTSNIATATKLQTARNIGGVSFDGTAAIDLPGVNTTGNQNTSGKATTAGTADTANAVKVESTTLGNNKGSPYTNVVNKFFGRLVTIRYGIQLTSAVAADGAICSIPSGYRTFPKQYVIDFNTGNTIYTNQAGDAFITTQALPVGRYIEINTCYDIS